MELESWAPLIGQGKCRRQKIIVLSPNISHVIVLSVFKGMPIGSSAVMTVELQDVILSLKLLWSTDLKFCS